MKFFILRHVFFAEVITLARPVSACAAYVFCSTGRAFLLPAVNCIMWRNHLHLHGWNFELKVLELWRNDSTLGINRVLGKLRIIVAPW